MRLRAYGLKGLWAPRGTSTEVFRLSRLPSYVRASTFLARHIARRCKYGVDGLGWISLVPSSDCLCRIDAIYIGHIVYTPSTFLDLIPDRYKQKPIALYEPREAPLLNQYRLIVPRTRNILEIIQFITLLSLYLAFMAERDPAYLSPLELAFSTYAFGWVLDQFATILEHGW